MAEIDSNEKVKKPKDSLFKQQKLPAWQPILTATTVLPLMFAIGISFIPLGIAFLITSNAVQEKIIDFTHCKSISSDESCANLIANGTITTCSCNIKFSLDSDFQAPVLIYYSLTNYYQNHRRYVKSRDDNQLLGSDVSSSSDCKPYDVATVNGSSSLNYAPCGVIANSLYNDSITLKSTDSNVSISLLKKGIAWSTDVEVKYKNPSDYINSTSIGNVFKKTMHPPNWKKNVWELGTEADGSNNGYMNEDLMVWMRTAALPSFRKLYRRVEHKGAFEKSLPSGNYTLDVVYNYPVIQFSGTKRIIITTTSFLGGKNPFLGIAYIVVGVVSFVIGIVFLVIHLRLGKRSKDSRSAPLNSRTPYYDSSLNVNEHQLVN